MGISRVWLALGVFSFAHIVAFALVGAAARHPQPGVRGAAWKYLVFGDLVTKKMLLPQGARLAARARMISWLAFITSALLIVFR